MPCYHPLTAFRKKDGGITFRPNEGIGSSLVLPCGQCIGCRLERSRQWAMRCVYESSLHQDNCFLTLTYSDDNLPSDGGLSKRHFQLFIKRLRRRFPSSNIRYFHCGEYGEQLGRPHYHALIFGFDFPDKEIFKRGDFPIFTSAILTDLWGHGHASIGAVTFDSAAYVARYVLKKVNGDLANPSDGTPGHYGKIDIATGEIRNVQPEYITMSLKPAIGRDWYDKFKTDVFPSDFLIMNGKKMKPPKYFDKLHALSNPEEMERLKSFRIKKASTHKDDSTPSRLMVRERVQHAQLLQLKRHKEF